MALEKESVLRSPSLSNLGPTEWLPEEGWREAGSFCNQWGRDQRPYHRQSQVHHGADFKKQTLQALREIWKFALKEMGMPGMCVNTRISRVSGLKEHERATQYPRVVV